MPLRIATAVVAASLALVPSAIADTPAPSTLTVDGNGSVFIGPDLATIVISEDRSATSSLSALSGVNRRIDVITASLRSLGVPSSAVQTESVSVSRSTAKGGPIGHRRRVRDFIATESISVTAATSLAGPVIDAASRAGATDVEGPSFSFSNPSAGVHAANAAALADALDQADAAAAGIGYTITGVQSVDLNLSYVIAPSGSAAAPSTAKSVRTSINSGVEEVDQPFWSCTRWPPCDHRVNPWRTRARMTSFWRVVRGVRGNRVPACL